jgi:hypothetical protein
VDGTTVNPSLVADLNGTVPRLYRHLLEHGPGEHLPLINDLPTLSSVAGSMRCMEEGARSANRSGDGERLVSLTIVATASEPATVSGDLNGLRTVPSAEFAEDLRHPVADGTLREP